MPNNPASARTPVVIIVQDDGLREAIRFNLYLDGFATETASDSQSGLALVGKVKPELILIDTGDALEIAAKIRSNASTRFIPVIMFVQAASVADIEEIFAGGIDDYITKPFKSAKLGQVVKQKLKKCQAAIEKKRSELLRKRLTVVAIDDEPAMREIVEKNLSAGGFKVITAQDGPEGIEAVKKIKPDLVLLDIMMPKMNGLEVLSTLKHDPETAGITVIMLTAEKLIGDMDRAFDIGADDYITKPVEGAKLARLIRTKLEKLQR